MRRVLVTGGNGQLGRAIRLSSSNSHHLFLFASHGELEIRDGNAIEALIVQHNIDTIINCAAYTNVETAEDNPDEAYAINHHAVATLTAVCRKHDIRLIHISTDYVFGGDSKRRTPYNENDTPSPINVYGASKTAGEREVLTYDRGVVIRTSWLYSPWGKNFCLTILRLAVKEKALRVVNDQHGTPTSAIALSEAIISIIESGDIDSMSGIYHYTDEGECSWYDFAKAILSEAAIEGCVVTACSSAERATRAQRPIYSVLGDSRLAGIKCIRRLPWRERLREVIDIIKQ